MKLVPEVSASEAASTVIAPFLKPSKIHNINWDYAANASQWGSTVAPGITASSGTEQVLYTAPSTIKYAFPHFPHNTSYQDDNDNLSNRFHSTTNNGHYYFFKIGGRMIIGNSRNGSKNLYFNDHHANYGDNVGGNIDGIEMYDVVVSYDAEYTKLMKKSHWIIHPGEDFVLFSGSASNSQTVRLTFEIHEFS